MYGFGPLLSRPLLALLDDSSLGEVNILAGGLTIEARQSNPIAEIVRDPRKRLVVAVEVTAVPIG